MSDWEAKALEIADNTRAPGVVGEAQWLIEYARNLRAEFERDLAQERPVATYDDQGTVMWTRMQPIFYGGGSLYTRPTAQPVVYQCPRCATAMEIDPTAKPHSAAQPVPQGMASMPDRYESGVDMGYTLALGIVTSTPDRTATGCAKAIMEEMERRRISKQLSAAAKGTP